MLYRWAADSVVAAHFAYVAFVVVGLLLTLFGRLFRWQWTRNFWFRMAHFASIGIVAAESWLGIICPLTTLEDWLRVQGGGTAAQGSFMGRLLHDLLFWHGEPWQFTLAYTAFGLLVAATLIVWPPRLPWRRQVGTAAAVARSTPARGEQ